MVKRCAAVIAAYLVLNVSTAYADPPQRLLPQYVECNSGGTRYACYTLDQQIQLNLLEENTIHVRTQLTDVARQHQIVAEIAHNLELQLAEFEGIDREQQRRISDLMRQLATEIEAKNQYRMEAESTDWWPLILGGVVGIVGVGLGVGILIKSAID